MNPFNTPPAPAHWLTPAQSKPGRNDALALVRATIRIQRRQWANHIGSPPLPKSRAGRPFEAWERAYLFENQDSHSLKTLAHWTGRTPAEILAFLDNEPVGAGLVPAQSGNNPENSKKKRAQQN